MSVTAELATVYRASTKGRRYLSKQAAIKAEARAIIMRKHPTERYENDTGYPGFHWRGLPRSHVLLRRVMRLVAAARDEATPKDPQA